MLGRRLRQHCAPCQRGYTGRATVAPGVTWCRVDPRAELRGLSLAVAGRITGIVVRLFEVFSCHGYPLRSSPYASPWHDLSVPLSSPAPPVACQRVLSQSCFFESLAVCKSLNF